MAKPVLLTVDDDREVLRANERDLRRKYGSDYRVLRAGSGQVSAIRLKYAEVSQSVVTPCARSYSPRRPASALRPGYRMHFAPVSSAGGGPDGFRSSLALPVIGPTSSVRRRVGRHSKNAPHVTGCASARREK